MDIFDNIFINQEEEILHVITEEDVDNFAKLTNDTNPLHMSDEFASGTQFRKRVVHGMLTASFISTIIGTKLPGPGSLWFEQNIKFNLPVRINDKIRVAAKVLHKSPISRIIVLSTIVYNENGEEVITGEAKVKVPEYKKKSKVNMSMTNSDNNKFTVIVTGGSGGIGSAVCYELAQRGHTIIVNYLKNKKSANDVCNKIIENGGSAIPFQADITQAQDVRKLFEFIKTKSLHVSGLVNNASCSIKYKEFEQYEWEDILEHFNVQIKGAFNMCKHIIPHLVSNKKGSIVNIGSIYTDNLPPLKMTHYCLAKSALHSLTKSLAVEYGNKGVRVNIVSPGMTNTDFIASVPDRTKMVTKMTTPLRRLAEPEEIAKAVAYLISDDSRYITGENLRICGGQIML